MGRLVITQVRPLIVLWLFLTLPVVCHYETTVAVINAVAAGHQHQHMLAALSGQPAGHRHGSVGAAPAGRNTAVGQPRLALPQWRADQAPPLGDGTLSDQNGAAFAVVPRPVPPVGLRALAGSDAAMLDPERNAPPAPPPRARLG